MKMPVRPSLLEQSCAAGTANRWISDAQACLPLSQARLPVDVSEFRNRNVLIRTARQLPAVRAMLTLDGVARRILLCPPDLREDQIPAVMQAGEVEILLSDAMLEGALAEGVRPGSKAPDPAAPLDTEWVLFTSGTSGFPKLVQHSLPALTGAIAGGGAGEETVWSTFYDVRRYGGLQILLRALLTGASMVLSDADEPVSAFLKRLGAAKVTHISGTPSHWRRALMSGAAEAFAPGYVRLSGEIADQPVLDRLRKTYAGARIAHAFASTEAGVVFVVDDGRAGFPAELLDAAPPQPEVKIQNGTLRVRSTRTAIRYLGAAKQLKDADDFVDTADMVELSDGRYHFTGRHDGVINLGGQKIYPEEVEAVINSHALVSMSRVWGRHSPITGTIIAADILLADAAEADFSRIRSEILGRCARELPPYKIPALMKRVPEIAVMASGKIERRHA